MEEAKKIELIYNALLHAKETIALACRKDGEIYCNMIQNEDEKLKEYYYDINDMLIELSDRNSMSWQKEENEN